MYICNHLMKSSCSLSGVPNAVATPRSVNPDVRGPVSDYSWRRSGSIL